MKYSVFDAHCDTPSRLLDTGERLLQNSGNVSLERADALPGYAQFFALWPHEGDPAEPVTDRFQRMLTGFRNELDANGDKIALCIDQETATAAMDAGKTAAFLSIEGAEAIDCDPGRLEQVYEQGVRMITPVWNHENKLAGSHLTGGGLTELGKEFVLRAQDLGIIIDVSHLSDKAFWDLCNISTKPVVASHSNARARCGHSRNLDDMQIMAIFAMEGAVGLNLYAEFLGKDPVALDTVFEHIYHFLCLGGEHHLCLGADFDGCGRLPAGITGIDDYGKLAEYLEARKVPEKAIQNIYFNNLMKVVKECCTQAQETKD